MADYIANYALGPGDCGGKLSLRLDAAGCGAHGVSEGADVVTGDDRTEDGCLRSPLRISTCTYTRVMVTRGWLHEGGGYTRVVPRGFLHEGLNEGGYTWRVIRRLYEM